MNEYIDFLKFQDFDTAKTYTDALEKHGISFLLEDISNRFSLVPLQNSSEDKFILKLRDTDTQKANQIFEKEIDESIKNITPNHYLYTFSDNAILEILANKNESTVEEISIAYEIAKSRNLKVDNATTINENSIKIAKPNKLKSVTIQTTAHWFSTFAYFSVLNAIILRFGITMNFPGLTITKIIDNAIINIYGKPNILGFVICLIIASIFLIISRYAKHNKWVFVIGMSLLFMDSLLLITNGNWILLLFNFLGLASLTNGLLNTLKAEKQNIA